jgi:hypothetical protein
MSLLNQMLQTIGGADIEALAGKLGLTPPQVESIVAALGRAHPEPGDTVELAAAKTGMSTDVVAQVLAAIGGEEGLKRIVGGLSQGGGLAGAMSGLFAKD